MEFLCGNVPVETVCPVPVVGLDMDVTRVFAQGVLAALVGGGAEVEAPLSQGSAASNVPLRRAPTMAWQPHLGSAPGSWGLDVPWSSLLPTCGCPRPGATLCLGP